MHKKTLEYLQEHHRYTQQWNRDRTQPHRKNQGRNKLPQNKIERNKLSQATDFKEK